ncbi:MAG: ATP-dependent sacrificial sulfur transferase LarE [Planctomycetota bacterium]
MVATYDSRVAALRARLEGLPGAVVAFSGGVDSTALLHACIAALGDRVLAVTADSPSLPRRELAEAKALATQLGARHLVLTTDELGREGYRRNGSDRCYFCKTELFAAIAGRLRELENGRWPVLYGAIVDDLGDHRPGARAAQEHGVLGPLAEVGLGKADVRRYSAAAGLPTADKPALACLASRVPYGTSIDQSLLARVEAAEEVLRGLGYRQLRVRHHGDVARLELEPEDLARAAGADRDAIVRGIRACGWSFVTLDLQGFRSGSLNHALDRAGAVSTPTSGT